MINFVEALISVTVFCLNLAFNFNFNSLFNPQSIKHTGHLFKIRGEQHNKISETQTGFHGHEVGEHNK